MGIKQRLKKIPVVYDSLLSLLNLTDYFNIRFWRGYPTYKPTERWALRIGLVKESPDNQKIKTVVGAGRVFHDHQRMHNGLKITLGSYYDYGNTRLLEENNGIHEPQEEFVFQEVLRTIPSNATMMELGSYWAFYSMWFARQVIGARCIMVEPDPHKMNFGKLNFKLNALKGTFEAGFIGQETDLKPVPPVYSVDYLLQKHSVSFLNILHSDIQGYEYKMLLGAEQSIRDGKIGCFFISTHSNELHRQCEDYLVARNFAIVCSVNIDESYSWDGVLVACHKTISPVAPVEIEKRNSNPKP